MAGLRGDEDFEVRYQCNDCTPSSGMHIFSANTSEQVTEAWLIKGSNGEFIAWYWDPACTVPVILGEDVRTEYCVMQSGKTLVFGLYGKTQMDIKLKMGAKNSLPSAKDRGTVYFAKDGDKNFGELYYDDENGNRVKVGGTSISQTYWSNADDTWRFYIDMEDGTTIGSNNSIPEAGLNSAGYPISGLMNHGNQSFMGLKTFWGIAIGNESMFAPAKTSLHITDAALSNEEESLPIILSLDDMIIGTSTQDLLNGLGEEPQILTSTMDEFENTVNLTSSEGNVLGVISDRGTIFIDSEGGLAAIIKSSGFFANQLGYSSQYIPTAYIEELHSTSIHSTMFTGAFTGDLEGNAKTATSWFNSIVLNGTEVKGDETEAITTAKWGTARNISISGTAGTTGTSIDGSSEEGYTLIIPQTLTNFTSITSTTMMATNLGSAATPVTTSHFKDTYFHNPNNNNYKHKLTSNAGSETCELQLPNTSGLLLSKPNATTSVGDVNSPVYVAVNGEVTACTTIAVDHGGTGAAALTTGGLLYGNNTSAVGTVNPTTKGRILVANGSNAAPIYASPTLSFTTGTNNPKVKMVINDATYESASGIQSATASNPGIVSTGTQTFAGAKTFNGAVTFGAGITSTTGTFSGQINANADIKIAAKIKSHSSGTSYITLTDSRATVTSPTLHLNGTTLVLNSSNYGTSLPTTGLEEGRVFFLLT